MRTRTQGRFGWFSRSAVGAIAVAAVGFLIGRGSQPPAAYAGPQTPQKAAPPQPAVQQKAVPPQAASPQPDYSLRVVAYIFNNVPITREELGEYLIARHGHEKIDLLVNKKIIEHSAGQRGVTVTAAEVEAALQEDLKGINVNQKDFVDKVLKQYGKTLYEWKEDVIRPRLMMTKLCNDQIQVTEQEIQTAFTAEFGPKVEIQLIIWPKGQEQFAFQSYDKIRQSDEEFERAARQQAASALAMNGGRLKPFGRGAGTHPEVEKEAFMLKPGEISRLIGTPEGTCCMKVLRTLPADDNAKIEQHRERLHKEVFEKRLNVEVPKMMKALRDSANPVVFMKKMETAEDLERNVLREIQPTAATQPPVKK